MAFYAFMPVAGFTFNGISYELSLLGVENLLPASGNDASVSSLTPTVVSWPLFALAMLVAVLALVAIFKFKQLKLQKTLCWACIILTISLIASMLVLINGWSDLRYYFSNCMPILAIVAFAFAIKGITKDQKTLSSYERLR